MKKNKKGFMQEEKNLEKVAGGLGGVDVDVKTGDISLVNINKNDNHKRADANWGVSGNNVQQHISGGFKIEM